MHSVDNMIFVAVLLAFVACVRGLPGHVPVSRIPAADGRFHVYTLPIGQGDARVIQCPGGKISIFDMGTCSGRAKGFWTATEIRDFLSGNFRSVTNIFITHDDKDHHNLLPKVFLTTGDLSGLQSIYVSGVFNEMTTVIQNWVNNVGARNKVMEFNQGMPCGSSVQGIPPCAAVNLCPGDVGITTQVLSVNAGQQCTTPSKNANSIVLGITYGSFKLQLNGDFEDCTENDNENGPQRKMANFYGAGLEVTVYMLAHHRTARMANKPVIRNAVKPKAVFVSSDPWYRSDFRHPHCAITDAFKTAVQPLCKPGETNPSSQFYCGQHPNPNADKIQRTYTCGLNNSGYRTINNNDYAIYSTTPDSTHLNFVHLLTDGTRWGFVNSISRKITRPTTSGSSRAPEVDECEQ